MLLPIALVFAGIGIGIAHQCGASRRELVAIAIGLLVAAVVPVLILAISGLFNGDYALGPMAVPLLIVFVFSSMFACLLGMPAFLVLRPFRPGHWWSVAAAGMLLGAGADALFRLGVPNLNDMVPVTVFGGASALAFWLIWRRAAPPPRPRTR
jgi:hypothetical protein